MAGSGTTGKMAIGLNRRALLIEKNPEFIAVIESETNVTPGLPLQTFSQKPVDRKDDCGKNGGGSNDFSQSEISKWRADL